MTPSIRTHRDIIAAAPAPDDAARLREFAAFHRPALEADETRHNIILAMLESPPSLRSWTLGAPGQCAMQMPGRPVVLGDLDERQCHAFADQLQDIDYPGVVGPDLTAPWLAERAAQVGALFDAPMPQMIHSLTERPKYPGAPGHARLVTAEDAPLLFDWVTAFCREAVPHDPAPEREKVTKAAGSGRYMFWTVDGAPVAMAAIIRTTRNAAAIAAVYTPPHLRARGYAGSVTAAVVEHAFAQGKTIACLYTDLRNPYSNRCYAKIGFKPVCESWFIPRRPRAE